MTRAREDSMVEDEKVLFIWINYLTKKTHTAKPLRHSRKALSLYNYIKGEEKKISRRI